MEAKFVTPALKKHLTRIEYEIPERYRNSFYLANAAFFDSTNWFVHRAYEVVFPFLRNEYRQQFQAQHLADFKIQEKLENIVESIDQCNSIVDVRFPIRRNNGNLEIIRGFRAHFGHSIRNTPCIGGLRIHENIRRDHMKALSVLSSMKNSCMGTGLSGAMGGIKINPKTYSEDELMNILDLYVNELFKKGYCNHEDVVHPDINTTEKEMKWINDSFARCSGQSIGAAVTGKPLQHGGMEDFYECAALGALKALETFVNNGEVMLKTGNIKTGLKNKRFIIQGLGKVGRRLGLMLVENGAVCVGVKEVDAYLYDSKGIDLKALYKHKDDHGTIENFGLSKTLYPDSIFTEECDILVLAACHKSLVCYVARDVKAKVILEAADGPMTPSAHKILTTKSKLVIPDIFACAGTSVASYFEYLRNLQQMSSPQEHMLSFSTEIYKTIFNNMAQRSTKFAGGSEHLSNVFAPLDANFTKHSMECVYSEVGQEILKGLQSYKLGVDIRTAAYAVAIRNIFKAIFHRKILT